VDIAALRKEMPELESLRDYLRRYRAEQSRA